MIKPRKKKNELNPWMKKKDLRVDPSWMFRFWLSKKKNEKGVVCVLLSRREWFVRKKEECVSKKNMNSVVFHFY